ncbi:MAG: universal stress protein [Bacteroidota bacterium]|nr:universal stress protein [Bacteroidota bacterium]
MNKIIAAFDGLKFSEVTLTCAIDLARKSKGHLVGISLEDATYRGFALDDVIDQKGFSEAKMKQLMKEDEKKRKLSSMRFEEICREAHIPYTIHHDKKIALRELLHESIYADLLIIDSRETLTKFHEKLPTRFIGDLLSSLQCPVLLVGREYQPVQKVALLYDGGTSSVYAIKMFGYLAGELKDLPVDIVTVTRDGKKLSSDDTELMDELVKRHFPQTKYISLKGEPEETLIHHLKNQEKNTLVVVGAYQRGAASRWLHPSIADALTVHLKNPLFIAHNKG